MVVAGAPRSASEGARHEPGARSASAEPAEAFVPLCAPDFLDNGLGGDYVLVI
jgi:hypothetical protein